MRKLGMIGGTSWHATKEYYELINRGFAEARGNWESPELRIFCVNIAVMRAQDKDVIESTYLKTAQNLEEAGAEAIIICANTPHMSVDYVAPKIGIPFLHIAHATANEAKRLGLRKLGLLGNRPTMTGNFISGEIERKFGLEIIIPDNESAIDRSHHFVSEELTQGTFSEEARDFYLHEMNAMKSRGADGIILGCTELPILLRDVEYDLPLLSTTHLHAQMALDFILNED